ncbi:TraR/DksA family transcriptional regulator [Horticoccus sp. 23ND18S-11]|uniref:TraR/DksA family transcriptional regulator n=1 Tax=Horticoccus sp. 23ND18S-11 TaxID=3391832 RepID=UPI0039C9520B
MKTPAHLAKSAATVGKAAANPRTTAPSVPSGTTPNSSGAVRIEPQWHWHYRTLLHLRDRLLRAQADHAHQTSLLAESHGVDLVDTAQEESVRDVLWAELGAEKDKLFEVDCALQRLREGSYGRCEESGAEIPPERLRAIPWARYSRDAAQRLEAQSTLRGKRAKM